MSLLLTNAGKSCRWVIYTFVQKPCSFKRFSIFVQNKIVVLTSLMEHLNARLLLANAAKICRCAADIINQTFKCKNFVDRCLKTCRWVTYNFVQKPSLFNHFWIRASFPINFFVCKINNLGGNQCLKALMASKCDQEKNSFTNQVVKDYFVFPLFFCQI